MKKLLFSLMLASSLSPAIADPIQSTDFRTAHSMGCMMMRECVDEVDRIEDTEDLADKLTKGRHQVRYTQYKEEIDGIISELDQMGVGVYLASDHYFVRGTAGIYYTVGNNFFLNERYVHDPHQLVKTLRHEAWHAAQDAMAGTIDNNFIAIIRDEEDVPREYVLQAEIAYGENNPALPWEKEAKWAGGTENMTLEVLRIINETGGKPWEIIEPTPLTREYLEEHGYID